MSSSAGRIRGGYDERSHLVGEAAYQGRIGATRLEPVHVLLDDGRVRTVTIHVGVNVGSDPHLKDAALAGALHRFEGGEELAVPYVLHDPVGKKLALVVPEVLRHRALEEHGKLLSAIAEDCDVPVPAYALEAKVVIGPAGLKTFLEKPDGKAALEALGGERDLLEAQRTALDMERGALERERQELARQREAFERERQATGGERAELDRQRQALGQEQQGRVIAAGQLEAERQSVAQLRAEIERERATLEQREQRVRERAEAVTSREDEIREEEEKQEAQSRDLSMREQELEQRLEALVQREQAVREREAKRTDERPKSIPPAGPRGIKSKASPIAEPADTDEALSLESVEELDDLEPVRTSPGRRTAEADDVEDAVEEIVDDDDVAEEVDPDALDLGVREENPGVHGQDEGSGPRTAIADLRTIARGEPAVGESAPPQGPRMPAELEGAEMIAEASDGVDLSVRLPEGTQGLGELDLLVRLSTEDGPVAVLELIGRASGGAMVSRRAALDLRSSEERSVLDLLRRRFEATVHFYSHDGRPFDEAKVSAPREVNAARVVDRGVRLKSDASGAVLKERALGRAVPSEPHPFGLEEGDAESAATVLSTLGPLADALAPERLDHALTVLSVPRDQIDQAVTRAIERAVSHGLALPSALAERALASAIVPDAAALVVRQIDAFRGTVLRPDRGRLDEAQIAGNWERLLKAAADNEVALDSETHDLAFRSIRALKGDESGAHAAAIDTSKLGELAPPQLVMLLEHPRHRRAAAIALAEKKDPSLADVLCKAVRKMPRAEVVRVMPKLVGLGEEAGDALIDGLSARKTFVRQGFALVLGHLKLRRAVVPILHRLIAEDSDVAKELARILATFGNAAFRPFARQIGDAKTDDARLVLTLAHLAIAGCEKQVRELASDSDARTKDLATRALASLAEARAQDETVKGTRALESGDPILAFSRRFEDELKGTAPEADLAGDD